MKSPFGGTFVDARDQLAVVATVGQVCHQIGDQPCIFHDDFAARMVGLGPDVLKVLLDGEDAGFRSGRFYIASRSRFVTESIAAATADGVRQLVIFGAGLATFCYGSAPDDLRIFEIDGLEFQTWKLHRLADVGIALPESLRYIPADGGPLGGPLSAAGFNPRKPTMFVWLGTLPLMHADQVSRVLHNFSECNVVEVILEYVEPHIDAISEVVKSLELMPLTSFPDGKIAAELAALGFESCIDLTVADLISRYTDQPFEGPIFLPLHLLRASRH